MNLITINDPLHICTDWLPHLLNRSGSVGFLLGRTLFRESHGEFLSCKCRLHQVHEHSLWLEVLMMSNDYNDSNA